MTQASAKEKLTWNRRELREACGPTALVGFTGDLLLEYPPGRAVELDDEVVEKMNQCDLVVANQEGPLTSLPPNKPRGGIELSSPPHCAQSLKELNVGVANLGNNHIMDHGPEGLGQTLEVLAAHGIAPVGAGRNAAEAPGPAVVDLPFGRLAVLAYSHDHEGPMASESGPGPASLDLEEAESLVADLRRAGHVVCVQYHGGQEFFRIPWPDRRAMFRRLAHAGAHLVIGHHAHVFQGIEVLGESVIHYGLGDFYFNVPHPGACWGTEVGILLAAELDARGPFAVRHLFVKTDKDSARLSALAGEQARRVARFYDGICSVLADDHLHRRAWQYECLLVAAANDSSSPYRLPLPAPISRVIRAARSLLNHATVAWKRKILRGAVRGLPALVARGPATAWHAGIREAFPPPRRPRR